MTVSRRAVIGGLGWVCGALAAPAAARIAPASMQPLVGLDYHPTDAGERGLWQDCGRVEEELQSSDLLLAAPAMHAYVTGVLVRLLGDGARQARLYIVHDPSLNAAMWVNGMITVNTGLLLRARSEAQLAAVLGHEAGHFLRRHSIARQRGVERKTAVMAFVRAGSGVLGGVTAAYGGDGNSWLALANSVNSGLYASLFTFDRQQEAEADAFGLRLIAEAGYPPEAAAEVWRQWIDEQQASAAARSKHYHAHASAFSTHPPDAVRMVDLTASAREVPSSPADHADPAGRGRWRAAVAPLRADLLDEQVKLNDPGASLYLVTALADDGWDGTLRFYEGEVYRLRDAPGDAERAATAYAAATLLPDAPPPAWRAHGYALLKAGQSADGRAALARYLDLAPAATDAAMVRISLAQ